MKKLEELENKEMIEERTHEDVYPVMFKQEEAKEILQMRMCKYYAHHINCRQEEQDGSNPTETEA